MARLNFLLVVSALWSATFAAPADGSLHRRDNSSAPIVTVKNGTLQGVYSSGYDQDFFLGIPYAQPPLGDLRFTNPVSINTTFNSTPYMATEYAPECYGYGSDDIGYPESEDCLYLNVIRPAGCEGQDLPVGVWIHGGGLFEGGTRDLRYNLSFIVENSVKIGKPIMAVAIGYRLAPFGFLTSLEVVGTGNTNMGLRDQRLALHWLQENIGAFGGDPSKVTIWGESAGAGSVGWQLTAYNGRDDGLFAAGIMESGNPIPYQSYSEVGYYQPFYDGVLNVTGCANSTNNFNCLQHVPIDQLNAAFNVTFLQFAWQPIIDGDFIQRYGSIQLSEGAFVKVPIIDGTNTDEGTSFGPTGVNNTQDFIDFIEGNTQKLNLSSFAVPQILAAYPDNTTEYQIPPVNGTQSVALGPPYGASYRRSCAYFGDLVMISPRRYTTRAWAANNVTAYSYRFNTIPAGVGFPYEVTHFQEVAFVFNNIDGIGYASNPFANVSQSYIDLSDFMSKSWASFMYDQNPNNWTGRPTDAPDWPAYDLDSPRNIVWDANVTALAWTEPDTYRQAGMQAIQDLALVYHR